MNKKFLIFYTGLIMALSILSNDLILPLFPNLKLYFGLTDLELRKAITWYIIAFGLGQLFIGALSDYIGRKYTVIICLVIFTLGTIFCLLAANFEIFIVGRFLQGVGASIGQVVSRAILRDVSAGKEYARNLSWSTTVFASGPILGPIIGAVCAYFWDWEIAFIILLGIILLVLITTIFCLKETLEEKFVAVSFKKYKESFKSIFSNVQARFFIFLGVLPYIILLLYINNLSYLYLEVFKQSQLVFGFIFSGLNISIIIGQYINRKLLNYKGVLFSSVFAAFFLFLTGLGLFLSAVLGIAGIVVTTILFFIFGLSFLVQITNYAALAIEPYPKIAGLASSVFGSVTQVVSGLLITFFLNKLIGNNFLYFGLTIGIIAIVNFGLVFYYYKIKR